MVPGISHNECLQVIRLKSNAINPTGIQSILESCLDNANSKIHTLDFEGLNMDEKNAATIEKLQKVRPNFSCTVGHAVRSVESNEEVDDFAKIVDIIREYLTKRRLRVVDLFNRWDKDKDFNITRDEFEQGVRSSDIPLSNYQVHVLLDVVDNDDNGLVDYREFAKLFKE